MGWIRFDENIMLDDWLNSLSQEVRWVWGVFVTYAGTRSPKWRVPVTDSNRMSQLLNVTPVTFVTLIESAIKNQKIILDGSVWIVKNGPKYDYDPTRAERQKRYREKNQEDTKPESNDSNGDARYSTEVTPTFTITNTVTPTITKPFQSPTDSPDLPEPKSETAAWMSDIVTQWNQMATELGYAKISKLTTERKKHLKARNKEPAFDFPAIVSAFKQFKPVIQSGKNGSEWKPNFDYVIRSESCYTKILEGNFASNGASNGQFKQPEYRGKGTNVKW